MFEGKIRKCLKCGGEGKIWDGAGHWDGFSICGCSVRNCEDNDSDGGLTKFQAVNQWNLANTPPSEIIYLRQHYAKFGMELPC